VVRVDSPHPVVISSRMEAHARRDEEAVDDAQPRGADTGRPSPDTGEGLADGARMLSDTFDAMSSQQGRPSIPPEQLLKASLLMVFYSARSELLFCEQPDYNLFRWFLDMGLKTRVSTTAPSRPTGSGSSSRRWPSVSSPQSCGRLARGS
jgi:hypothetical protein